MGLRKPNIVLVPGAFSFASTYSRLLEKLTTLEYAAEVLELPSAGSSPPLKGPDDDVAALQSLLSSNVEQGNEVVLVCHSYGGIVASNAVEEFTLARRREAGKEGGVILVIYMAAFALPKGQSLFNLLGGEPQHWMIVEDGVIKADPAQNPGFNDLSPEDVIEFLPQMTHTSISCFLSPVTYEPWEDVPCMYIHTTQDAAIPYALQAFMASQMRGATAFVIDRGHCPYITAPATVVEGIESGIRDVSIAAAAVIQTDPKPAESEKPENASADDEEELGYEDPPQYTINPAETPKSQSEYSQPHPSSENTPRGIKKDVDWKVIAFMDECQKEFANRGVPQAEVKRIIADSMREGAGVLAVQETGRGGVDVVGEGRTRVCRAFTA